MRYRLHYWPGIQGRGEFVRLMLEDMGADYLDLPPEAKYASFAPPYLKAGRLVIGQTANILYYLSRNKDPRLLAQQLTITDWAKEAHDTHHPIASSLYYEEQRKEAKRHAHYFRAQRLPKYLHYFETAVDTRFSHVHLSLFQMIEGLRYAFPKAMKRLEKKAPKLARIHDQVANRPRIAAYLASGRRIPPNRHDLFRHYPELDP